MTGPYWSSHDSRHAIYFGDCREIMPELRFDAVVMDPPYGIVWEGHSASTLEWSAIRNDSGGLDLRGILALACPVVSFGANCYPDQLPHRGRWVCWDKRTIDGSADAMLGSPFELAWCNRHSGFDRMIRVLHGGVVNADREPRQHPTQKPVEVFMRIIDWFTKKDDTILDPFMGSGTTGVACVRMGRGFIGVEINERYCEVAAGRLSRETSQQGLFAAAAAS